ncbi:hypothetical protein KUA04_17200 [Proteus mirabilis]|uniref:hypothetical protein n=1 Tax=Proteus mirabilis TaxID=584 RepID=UPI001A1FF236|nr:hypothetical protein [Proteus mirabilis]MBI6281492.1 hypothetical protein [Proteus mirabilis]MCT0090157.1 hypothetical protein [Proteus mirabilis]HCT3785963.1 hypothetical protein [Proteus mirabilis]HEK3221746.1 hypothetical protein [Proteus mirabilis]
MLKDNEKMMLSEQEAIDALSEIECIFISLSDIARYYYTKPDGSISAEMHQEYCAETTRFIDENNITRRLAKVRSIISKNFNDDLGEDDMDDIERAMEKIKYWENQEIN